jgi:hypothetical protein
MSAEKRKKLLAEYKSIKEREVDILAELFELQLDTSDTETVYKPTRIKIGDKVKLLSGGVNSRWGDEGVVVKLTDKRCEVRLSRNKAIVRRAFTKIERV